MPATTSKRWLMNSANALDKERAPIMEHMPSYTSEIIGFLFGFGFGVGCALAVMYSIYMGGYRAALRDEAATEPSERLLKERHRLQTELQSAHPK